jgi:molecular chaperone DnaJ
VDNGTQIRLAGEGQPGINGGPNGNLYLAINVRPHKIFRRRENDILMDLTINVAQAVLGGEIEVPTVDGKEKLFIPPGTQSGKILTLKNKGAPRLRGNGRGDQLIMVNVEIPSGNRITKEQKKLFEQLAQTLGSEVHPQERSFWEQLKDFLSS